MSASGRHAFRKIYDAMQASSLNYEIRCNKLPPPYPNPGYSPAKGGPGFGWPPPYVITIDSNVTSYGCPGVDGENHFFTIEGVISHEMAHTNGVSVTEQTVIGIENLIMNQVDSSSINRAGNTHHC